MHAPKQVSKNSTSDQDESVELDKLRQLLINRANDLCSDVQDICNKYNEKELRKFLRVGKHDCNKAYDMIRGYAGFEMKYPELFENISEDALRSCIEEGEICVIPGRDPKGRAVVCFRFESWDPSKRPFLEVMKSMRYIFDKLLDNEEIQTNEICLVEDFKTYNLRQLAAAGIKEYKVMIDMLQDRFSAWITSIHCIRQPWYFGKVFNMIKPFLRSQLFQKIYMHGKNLDLFVEEFSEEFLPADLGGTGPLYDGVVSANSILGIKV
ncbi:retinaldehyde-binding protein 1-like [Clavelina lepadiformis]|uniref:CRAL-TRIO domain-containing protein n=1 Tax=Clavelina lepadiformis TaxID=159417 RepID=A0ABP0FPQ3_CLALP